MARLRLVVTGLYLDSFVFERLLEEDWLLVVAGVLPAADNEKPILLKEPLKYEAIKVQTRNYKS